MVKKYIFHGQAEDKKFWEFVAGCSIRVISVKFILLCSGNTIWNWIIQKCKKQKLYLNMVILR